MKNLFCIIILFLGIKIYSFGQTISATTGASKNVILETAVGSNLPFAPDAYCIQNGLEVNNTQLIIINNHNGNNFGVAPLKYLSNDQWISTYITGFPQATIDRAPYNNAIPQARNNWQAAINSRGTSASYQLNMDIEQIGQSLNIRLIGKALTNLFGEYRFNVMVVEDSVIQNQRNYYTSGNCSFMSSGDPIVNFPHRNVLRAFLGTEWGMYKCNNPLVNQLDTMNFSYTIPTNFNKKNLKIIGVIQKYDANSGQREIMNSLRISLSSSNSTNIAGGYLYSNFTNTKVGSTLNNQQTNGSSYRRVQILPNNNVGVTWTTSNDASPFIGRGTGYNRFNGNNWIKSDTTSIRIESQRSGFPSYAFNPTTNEEIVLSHIVTTNGFSGGFVQSRKNVAATTWNQTTVLDTIATVPGLLWCRTAVSNNYLHVVACYTDSAQNQPNRVARNGVRTPVVYSRLNLITNVWEVKAITLPNYNSLRYYNGSNDSYSIDAIGNNVAILIGSAGQDLSLWKSGNNGTSWARTIIDTFYQAPFIEKSTIIDPAVLVSDNHVHVLLDNNGVSHCFWSQISLVNPDTTDGNWNYYPSASNQELKYWKEGTTLSNKLTIATFNGDPVNTTNWQQFTNGNDSRYGTSYYTAHPSAGISSDGKIYCVYSSPTEGENNIGTRDIYAIYSTNSGQSWSTPKNLTAVLGSGLEQAYPSIARTVNNKIHLVYSQSGSVGPNTAGQWDINYYAIDTGLLDINDTLITNQSVSFTLSDTVLCKGKELYYSINNANLYVNDTLVVSGVASSSFTPTSNKNIKIKSLDGLVVFKNVNIIVIDSLNLQSVFNGANLNSSQVSICGTNKSFQLGVSTNYAGTKSVVWKLNNSTLFGRNNMIDTFSQGGSYEVTIQTPSGCRSSKEVLINKNNSNFNVDFTVDRQIANAPPFNFIFTNLTPQLVNYDFYWNWGDGKIDTTNSQNLFPKTYLNNGFYTVKLTAQHKQTGCKDSVTKVNYISCSGSNPQPLSLTTSKLNPSCFGSNNGSITVNATGGTAPYLYRINGGTYQSNNVFSNLTGAVYDVDVKDAQNNVVSKKDTLLNPAALVVGGITGLSGVPVNSTQTYNVNAQTGLSYNWSVVNGTLLSGNGTNAIQVRWGATSGIGKINISITKNGCQASDSLMVSIGANPLTFTTVKQNESCPGTSNGSISITAMGGNPPYVYALNNGSYQSGNVFNNLSGGIYAVQVKDNNQIVTTKYDTITTGIKPTAGIITGPTTVATLAMNNYIVGQQTGVTYLWTVTGGVVASGQNTNVAQVAWGSQSMQGKVLVKVTNAGGCSDSSDLGVNVGSVGTTEIILNSMAKIYPNPTKGNFTIDVLDNQIEDVEIYNSIGVLVWTYTSPELKQHQANVDLKAASGVYMIHIKTNVGIVKQRIVITD